jgi:predicted DNA-binding antitoxin AbrB/MazE fold protein
MALAFWHGQTKMGQEAEGKTMSKTIAAVYENGVFRPLESMSLAENDRVEAVVSELSEGAKQQIEVRKALAEAYAEFTGEDWRVFDEATRRRPMFGGRTLDL